jgi:hypothetical protein
MDEAAPAPIAGSPAPAGSPAAGRADTDLVGFSERRPRPWARAWFAATAICAVVGVAVSVGTAANNHGGFFHSPTLRALNTFAFFTVDSNLIVAVTTGLLALRPERRSLAFRSARLTGLVCITVTGVVYHVALASLLDLQGWDRFGNEMVHTAVPILTVAGWLLFGPRAGLSATTAWWSLTFPVAWLTFTLARGAVVGFYPYPFIDVTAIGYAGALLNCVWVSALLLGLAGAAVTLDRQLSRSGPPG